jgi:NAD(P)-dependent dehydrogenase (short-subunit alcohol dehydrogenase family)
LEIFMAATGCAATIAGPRAIAIWYGAALRSEMPLTAFAHYPSLAGRAVLITGGATGIGATLVEQFAAQGARVAFIDIERDAAEALVATLAGAGHPPFFVAADLTDIAALDAAIAAARRQLGPITVLLNNAANDQRHAIETVTSASWDAGIAVNLKHQFFAARNVAADMKAAGGGSIVNFGSISWKLKQGGMPVYTTAKAAAQGLTRSLARDFGPFNIRVNTLVPGWVMTDRQIRLWLDDKGRADIARGQCLSQPLLPLHIAHMALFLAADDSAMCTAQDFVVDAGWT